MRKILIVDDSSVMRSQLAAALRAAPGIDVVGTAQNGAVALTMLKEKQIDLAIVDVEMPEMNGLELLEAMNKHNIKVKTIMFAGATKGSALASLKALNRGAFDFVQKPNFTPEELQSPGGLSEKIRSLLLPKIELALSAGLIHVDRGMTTISAAAPISTSSTPAPVSYPPIRWSTFLTKAIVIGSSTGGPTALEKVFTNFNSQINVPIFIVQHMPPVFTAALGERLSELSGLKVAEAKDLELVEPNRVYIAPGNYHMRVVKGLSGNLQIKLDQGPQRQSVRPAVDNLFESAAEIYGQNLLGFVFTGMGADGKEGALAIKKAGGGVVIQDKETCVVYGMPKAVADSGAFDKQLSLDEMRSFLIEQSSSILKRKAT